MNYMSERSGERGTGVCLYTHRSTLYYTWCTAGVRPDSGIIVEREAECARVSMQPEGLLQSLLLKPQRLRQVRGVGWPHQVLGQQVDGAVAEPLAGALAGAAVTLEATLKASAGARAEPCALLGRRRRHSQPQRCLRLRPGTQQTGTVSACG